MRYITGTLLAFCLFVILPSITQAASFTTNDFITTWDTTKAGTSASNQITIPGTGAGYSYSIYWESLSSSTATGTIATSTSASQTITFPEAGQYKVAIKGTYPRIYFNNTGDKLKILTVEQWGSPAWTSMASAFYGCANLTVPATDAPNLASVTSLQFMFRGATTLNEPIDHWNVSNVTGMGGVFYGASSFNQPLNSWNTSKVTNMGELFRDATNFNQPLNNWNTASATSMTYMFASSSFNQIIDNWSVSNVTDMSNMFRYTPFNKSLNSWDVSNVVSMSSMFQGTHFNQPLNNWNTGKVQRVINMFRENTVFNQPLNSWDMSSVWSFSGMFRDATAFNQPLSSWNTASATNMFSMFRGATAFDQNLSNWTVSNIVSSTTDYLNGLENMFYNAGLSQSNLDSTLQSWAGQSLKSNVPFHLGLKTYSSTGATALNTLRNTYNWTISEQYQAEYQEGDDYNITGTTTQTHVGHGSTTTEVEVIPNDNCTFLNWSDGNTTNPRTDTLTDNLTLTAVTKCASNSSGSSAKTRYKKLLEYGNTTEAEEVKDKYLTTTPANPTIPSLETAITNIKTLTTDQAIISNPQTRQQLISILQQLVQILRGMAGESS
jgi:surface protein